jgi:hypothetical protein
MLEHYTSRTLNATRFGVRINSKHNQNLALSRNLKRSGMLNSTSSYASWRAVEATTQLNLMISAKKTNTKDWNRLPSHPKSNELLLKLLRNNQMKQKKWRKLS